MEWVGFAQRSQLSIVLTFLLLLGYQIGQGVLVIFVFGFWAHYVKTSPSPVA